jgi:hypothetical protein
VALVQTIDGDVLTVSTLVASWNGLNPVKIHLIKADWVASTTLVPAGVVEADFPGYAVRTAAGWTAPLVVAGRAVSNADPLVFTRTVTGTAQTIWGYWAELTSDPGKVYWAEKFAASVILTVADEACVVYPQYTNITEFLS